MPWAIVWAMPWARLWLRREKINSMPAMAPCKSTRTAKTSQKLAALHVQLLTGT